MQDKFCVHSGLKVLEIGKRRRKFKHPREHLKEFHEWLEKQEEPR